GNIYVPGTALFNGYVYQNNPLVQRQYNVVDSLAFTYGTHSVKVGEDYRRLFPRAGEGQYGTFYNLGSLQDIQQGTADSLFTVSGIVAYPVFNNLSLFVQDHWKILPHVTFDYGLRWELNPPPGASNGISPLALTSSNLATAQVAPSGTSLYHTAYHNFAPRVG